MQSISLKEIKVMFKLASHRTALALLIGALLFFVAFIGQAMAQDELPPALTQDGVTPSPIIGSTDNHTPGTATPLGCTSSISGVISAPGEVDYYKIDDLAAGTPIVVKITNAIDSGSLDAFLTLYDKDGTTILATQDDFNSLDPRLHYETLFNDSQGFGSEHYVSVRDFQLEGGANYVYTISWSTIQYVSMASSGSVGGVNYDPGDILARTRCSSNSNAVWEMFFDGSDVGFDGNLRDFAVLNGSSALPRGGIIVSTAATEAIPNFGKLVPQDLALFRPLSIGTNTLGSFERFFDASDVGLTKKTEAIDTVSVHPTAGALLLGTVGKAAVPGVAAAADEDILLFSPTNLGTTTSGAWALFFDGSDAGLGLVDVVGAHLDRPGSPNPNGFLTLIVDANITLGGILRTPNTTTPCFNGTFGQNTTCSWGQQAAFWRLTEPGLTAIDGYDQGSSQMPTGFTVAAAATDGSEKSDK